ncbi:hypothetical protein [Vineibacter terrae]|uniref:hypothetical protein n=1 Tax=Vineibacter terrae TaxID=2586908 RepID=UPI002E36A9B3|nr:hypothetical protein [Vineibacter terrae]HEX2889908.1 hypothetical protein [Vineibacter terrae]
MKNWRPDHELRRLLDALSAEILAAPEEEVLQAGSATGRTLAAAVRDIRELIATANEGQEEADPGLPLAEARRRRETCLRQH